MCGKRDLDEHVLKAYANLVRTYSVELSESEPKAADELSGTEFPSATGGLAERSFSVPFCRLIMQSEGRLGDKPPLLAGRRKRQIINKNNSLISRRYGHVTYR